MRIFLYFKIVQEKINFEVNVEEIEEKTYFSWLNHFWHKIDSDNCMQTGSNQV